MNADTTIVKFKEIANPEKESAFEMTLEHGSEQFRTKVNTLITEKQFGALMGVFTGFLKPKELKQLKSGLKEIGLWKE